MTEPTIELLAPDAKVGCNDDDDFPESKKL